MAKKIEIFVDTWEGKHYKRVNKYARQIDDIFSTLSQEAGIIGASVTNFNKNKPFTFADYPGTKQRIEKLLSNLQNNISLVINDGTRKEWLLACLKNDEIVKKVFDNQKLSKVRLDHYYSRNLDALDAFQARKVNGMNLSDRVWNLTDQTKQELEMSIDLGLTEGKSASQMSREIKRHLNDPNKLFRRVKDERGVLQLSKNAKAYHPGQGVYRSSKENAMRLTRTETNMAYRASDNERWNQLDFILGYEIKRSNNPYPCPVCEDLKGKYPKTFKFMGWHPNCRCFQVPILADLDKFFDYETKILNGEDIRKFEFKNEITKLPDNFTQWLSQNSQTLASRKSVPYFIRDNFKSEDIKKGLKPISDNFPTKSKEYIFDAKKLEDRGFRVNVSKGESYNRIAKGFNMEKLDDDIMKLMCENNIEPRYKTLNVHKGYIEFTYQGSNDFRLVRTIQNDKVYHDFFKVPKDLQGKGISKKVFQSLYEQYNNANLKYIEVHANIDVGGYTWAKYGFSACYPKVRNIVSDALFQKKITQKQFDEIYKIIDDYDSKNPKSDKFPMNLLTGKPYSKKLLLETDWKGILDLTDKNQRTLFENYILKR